MTLSAAFRYAIYAGVFAVLLLPFVVVNDLFFPFITGKNFAFRIIVEIIFALWIILALREPSVRPKASGVLYALLGLIITFSLAAILGENPSKSFWSNFERMEGLISFIHFGMYFIVVSSVMTGEKLWRRFIGTQIGASVLMALYGLCQLAGFLVINQGGVRVDGTFGNATYLAIYMLMSFFLTLMALSTWKPGRLLQVGLVAAAILQVVMIFYAATRGTILGLVGGLGLAALLFMLGAKGEKQLRAWGIGVVVAILVLVGGFMLVKDTDYVKNHGVLSRVASISLEAGQTRFAVWSMAAQGISERPILGWGQENFNYVFNTYYRASMHNQEPWFDRAHNEFLDVAIAGGLVALGFYLALFVLALWYLWKPGNTFALSERALLTALLAGYAFHNLFVFDNLMSYVLFFTVLAFITVRHRTEAPVFGGTTVLAPAVVTGISAATVLLLIVGLWVMNAAGLARANQIIEGMQSHGSDITKNFEYFQQATAGGGIGRQEAHEQMIQFAIQAQNPQLASLSTPELRSAILQYTAAAFNKENEKTPNDARLRLFFGSFLRQMGDLAGARSELTKAHDLSPNKQSILFELGALAAQENNGTEALAHFKEAYELAPEYEEARGYYAAALIRAGMSSEVPALLAGIDSSSTVLNNVMQAYLDVGDFASLVSLMQARIAANPTNYNLWVQLGAAYLQAGDRVRSVEALEKAIELNPAFKEQGEYFITEIKAGRNP